MIEPGELHRYHAVREVTTGRQLRLLNGDVRYKVTGDGPWDYRPAPDGGYFLVESGVHTHPWGRAVRLDEVEPLPDGHGLWGAGAWEHERTLALTYEGSWRQYADGNGHLPAYRDPDCQECGFGLPNHDSQCSFSSFLPIPPEPVDPSALATATPRTWEYPVAANDPGHENWRPR